MGIGFAVPVNLTHFVIEQLKSKGKVERGWIGIKIQPNSGDIAHSLSQQAQRGVIVSSVSEGSSAKAAGIEAGDIILSFDGQPIDDAKNFSRMVAETEVGKTINLEIWRDKQIRKISLPVMLMPEEPSLYKKAKEENRDTAPLVETVPERQNAPDGLIDALEISVADLTPEILNKYSLSNDARGVVVTGVVPGSDAELKGLSVGRLITQIDKKAIFDINDVKTYVNDAKIENNRPVLLLVNDNNVPHYVAVKLKSNE